MMIARNLKVVRGGRPVVSDACCRIRKGQLTAICGPNGAGKSTLLMSLAGLVAPCEGEVSIEGQPIGQLTPRERARLIGFLPQQAEAAWDVDVRTLISLGRLPWRAVPGRPVRAKVDADRAAIASAISDMQLEGLADRPVSRLSGGEKARTMMGRVLAGDPRYILADEPFASLDIGHASDLVRLMKMQASRGLGLAVVMHDLALAMNHADRVIVLDRGRIVADAPPDDALSEEAIARVWKARVRWLGEPGSRALAV